MEDKKPTLTKKEREQKKQLAYILFVNNGLDQKSISEITGISEKTISGWKIENKWEYDRDEQKMGFEQQRKRIKRQITTMLDLIETREPPKNMPTAPEGDTINKLADAAKKLQTELSLAHKIETGKQFISFVQKMYGPDTAFHTISMWHEFIMQTS